MGNAAPKLEMSDASTQASVETHFASPFKLSEQRTPRRHHGYEASPAMRIEERASPCMERMTLAEWLEDDSPNDRVLKSYLREAAKRGTLAKILRYYALPDNVDRPVSSRDSPSPAPATCRLGFCCSPPVPIPW